MNRKNLFGLTLAELEAELAPLPKFRAKQIAANIYKHGVKNFGGMNDLPKALRAELETRFEIKVAEILTRLDSADGLTTKFLLGFADGAAVEIVIMRHDYGNGVCISSQVGCQMGCAFCASTLRGLQRNLTAAEMLGEIFFADEFLRGEGRKLDSVVVMGTGEPLMNFDALIKMLRLLHEDYCLGMSFRKITISTCGVVPAIKKLRDEKIPVTLSISLHAPDDRLRSELMPINSAFGLKTLLAAVDDYAQSTGRRVTCEYILLGGVNDTEEHARRLAKILSGRLVNVNLIPFNPVDERSFRSPTKTAVQKFFHFLNTHGVGATIRKEMGADVNAACGQLRAKSMRNA